MLVQSAKASRHKCTNARVISRLRALQQKVCSLENRVFVYVCAKIFLVFFLVFFLFSFFSSPHKAGEDPAANTQPAPSRKKARARRDGAAGMLTQQAHVCANILPHKMSPTTTPWTMAQLRPHHKLHHRPMLIQPVPYQHLPQHLWPPVCPCPPCP